MPQWLRNLFRRFPGWETAISIAWCCEANHIPVPGFPSSVKSFHRSCFPPLSQKRSFTAWIGLRGESCRLNVRPRHQRTGARGEEDACFHLRKLGYAIVARNFRSPRCRGEIGLIGWDADVLRFIEVKTRTSRDVKTPEAAVDRHKRREVAQVAREYLRRLPPSCQWRFDIVGVYYANPGSRPQIEVFRNASLSA